MIKYALFIGLTLWPSGQCFAAVETGGSAYCETTGEEAPGPITFMTGIEVNLLIGKYLAMPNYVYATFDRADGSLVVVRLTDVNGISFSKSKGVYKIAGYQMMKSPYVGKDKDENVWKFYCNRGRAR